ncbi:MAG: ankyrin repeat domain-containing protein, partial [Verrucomicrobiia bacterium]
MKTIRQTLLLLLAGILGAVVAVFLLKLVRTVPIYRHGGGGNACVQYQRLPMLDPAETKPILDRAIQRVLQRLVQARDHLPALSDIGKASIEDCGFTYRKGSASRDRAGNSTCDPPDSCCLSLHAKYPFNGSVMLSIGPSKEYPLEDDGFAYYTWLAVASGAGEIHGIIDQEMDRAAEELQKAARSKMLKAGEGVHIAVRAGDAAKVEQLLAAKPELANARDSRGYTPLHWARDPGVAERLLARTPDVNAADTLGLTPLHWAVYENRFEVVKVLVAHKADINRIASDGWTPTSLAEELLGATGPVTFFLLQHGGVPGISDATLNYLVSHPGASRLKRVLQSRPDVVSMKDEHGRTALHNGVASQNKDAVELLLSYCANDHVRDEKGETPLEIAQRAGSPAIVDLLQKYNAMKRGSAIHDAIHHQDMAQVKKLLASRPMVVNEIDPSGRSPLHTALSRNNNEMLKLLLDHHANINARDDDEQTPLHFAVVYSGTKSKSGGQEAGESDIKKAIAMLLAHGADVNARDRRGETPLHCAARRTKEEAVELLLANKAGVNATNRQGETPLHYAVHFMNDETAMLQHANEARVISWYRQDPATLSPEAKRANKEVAELLLANKADINARDGLGKTPLHHAANRANKEAVEFLLAHKADINATNRLGETALHCAVNRTNNEIAEIARARMIPAMFRNPPGRAPIRSAVTHVHKEAVELLLANKAGVNARNRDGETPLHCAAKGLNKEAVELLLANKADVNAKDNRGRTPMDHVAMRGGDPDLHPIGALLRSHGGRRAKEPENAPRPQPKALTMVFTRNGERMAESQLKELKELPDVKAALEARKESRKKYDAAMNEQMTTLGYQTVTHTNVLADGTTQIHLKTWTSDGRGLTRQQLDDLRNKPELKALQTAAFKDDMKYMKLLKEAAAKLGYQM